MLNGGRKLATLQNNGVSKCIDHTQSKGRILTLSPNYKPLGARRFRRFSVASPKINRFVRLRLDIEAA
jgi:hypothetical protein